METNRCGLPRNFWPPGVDLSIAVDATADDKNSTEEPLFRHYLLGNRYSLPVYAQSWARSVDNT